MNMIFNCPKPQGDCTSGTFPSIPSNPTAVSCYLGDRTAGASPGYPIVFPLSNSPLAINTTTNVDDGIAYPTNTTIPFCTTAPCTAGNTALSIADFNVFRSNVKASIDILDQKIRDILMIAPASCPWQYYNLFTEYIETVHSMVGPFKVKRLISKRALSIFYPYLRQPQFWTCKRKIKRKLSQSVNWFNNISQQRS